MQLTSYRGVLTFAAIRAQQLYRALDSRYKTTGAMLGTCAGWVQGAHHGDATAG